MCEPAALSPAPLRHSPAPLPARKPYSAKAIRLLLAASFASGTVFFALEVILTHLVGVVIWL